MSHEVDALPQINGSPFHMLISSAEPSLVEFSPEDGVVGVAGAYVYFFVHLRDEYGNPRIEACNDVVTGSIPSGSNASQVIQCLGNGNYKVGFRTEAAGRFQLTVRLDKEGAIDIVMDVDDLATHQPSGLKFEYPIRIRPANPSANQTTLVYVPPEQFITVTLRDSYGNGVAREHANLVFTALLPNGAKKALSVDPVHRLVSKGNGSFVGYVDTEEYVNSSFAVGLEVSLAEGHGLRSIHAVNGRDHVVEGIDSTLDIVVDETFVAEVLQEEDVGPREVQRFCQGTQLSWTGFVRADHDANYTFTLLATNGATAYLSIADGHGGSSLARPLQAGLVYPIHAKVSGISPGTMIKLIWAAETPEATSLLLELPGTAALVVHSSTVIPSEDLQGALQQGDLLYIDDGTTDQVQQAFTVLHYDNIFQRITFEYIV